MHLSRLLPKLTNSERKVLKDWCDKLPKEITTVELQRRFEKDKIGKSYQHNILKNKVRLKELERLYKELGGSLKVAVVNSKLIRIKYDVMVGDRVKWAYSVRKNSKTGKSKTLFKVGEVLRVYNNYFLCEFEISTGEKIIKIKESLSFQDLKDCVISR